MNAKYASTYNFSRISRTKNEYRNWDQQHRIKVERKHHRVEMHHLAMFKLQTVQNFIYLKTPMQHERDWKLREFFSYNEHQNHSAKTLARSRLCSSFSSNLFIFDVQSTQSSCSSTDNFRYKLPHRTENEEKIPFEEKDVRIEVKEEKISGDEEKSLIELRWYERIEWNSISGRWMNFYRLFFSLFFRRINLCETWKPFLTFQRIMIFDFWTV